MVHLKLPLLIVASGLTFLIVLAPFDLALISYFYEQQSNWFGEMMSDSMFELERPGGGDVVTIFVTLCFLLYCVSSLIDSDCGSNRVLRGLQNWLARRPGWSDVLRRQRFRLEFLVVSSFFCSTLMVKSLKWIMARPRPKKILWGTREFSEWYEVGPYFLDEGTYRASFPSGHTASAITLIGVAYLLLFTSRRPGSRTLGMAAMLGALGFAAAMGVARVMTVAHWPTDVVFSIFAGWLLIHILFFYGFNLGNLGSNGELYPPPPFRAVAICWYLSLVGLGLVGAVLGYRHFSNDRWPWLILLTVGSVPLICYGGWKAMATGLFQRD
jgi:membrane-associated phospholipid phosphatase